MPHRLRTYCPATGCNTLTHGGRCEKHRLEAYTEDRRRRGTSTQRGYTAEWALYSTTYRKAHPWCACGCGAPSQCVDHIQPVSGPDDPLFWDPSNHQALAWACHSRKTATQDQRGVGGHKKRNLAQPVGRGKTRPLPPTTGPILL